VEGGLVKMIGIAAIGDFLDGLVFLGVAGVLGCEGNLCRGGVTGVTGLAFRAAALPRGFFHTSGWSVRGIKSASPLPVARLVALLVGGIAMLVSTRWFGVLLDQSLEEYLSTG
jgi:hypothetical protein